MTRDPQAFITRNLRLTPVPFAPDLTYHAAHPGSGLSRLGDEPPYWAYLWPGGAALIQHLAAHPDSVTGRRVLDLGAGSGMVGIAAAKAGATVTCSETSSMGRAAIALNATANGVTVGIVGAVTGLPEVDLILAGDCFYDPAVAAQMSDFLDHCARDGIAVLVGDIGRPDLPLARLAEIASYPVREVGVPADRTATPGRVFRWIPNPA
jgi:predicted nicotinamide N-methyase